MLFVFACIQLQGFKQVSRHIENKNALSSIESLSLACLEPRGMGAGVL